MLVKNKHISLQEARKISEVFCEDMNVTYCGIYYVDRIEMEHVGQIRHMKNIGLYVPLDPPHILMIEKSENKLTLLLHELVHHLDAYRFTFWDINELTHSSKGYIRAKSCVVTWCKNNISNRVNWNKMLKCILSEEELKNFKL